MRKGHGAQIESATAALPLTLASVGDASIQGGFCFNVFLLIVALAGNPSVIVSQEYHILFSLVK